MSESQKADKRSSIRISNEKRENSIGKEKDKDKEVKKEKEKEKHKHKTKDKESKHKEKDGEKEPKEKKVANNHNLDVISNDRKGLVRESSSGSSGEVKEKKSFRILKLGRRKSTKNEPMPSSEKLYEIWTNLLVFKFLTLYLKLIFKDELSIDVKQRKEMSSMGDEAKWAFIQANKQKASTIVF